jgi:excisionase family DNA binding protein
MLGGGRTPGRKILDKSQTMRVTVEEAAQRLGIEKQSVKKRIQRGKLRSERDGSGTTYVYVDTSETARDGPEGGPGAVREELVDELRYRVAYLERQVEEEREARRRADTILAQLSQANAEQARTIRAIEAPASSAETPTESDSPQSPESPGPSDTPPDRGGGPESPTDEQQGRGPIPEGTSPQTGGERPDGPSWWRRVFGQ